MEGGGERRGGALDMGSAPPRDKLWIRPCYRTSRDMIGAKVSTCVFVIATVCNVADVHNRHQGLCVCVCHCCCV